MDKMVFIVADRACFDGLDIVQPKYKFKLVHEGDSIEEHVAAFKMVLRAMGHCEDNVSRIQCEGFEQRLARHKKEKEVDETKNRLYDEYMVKTKEEGEC